MGAHLLEADVDSREDIMIVAVEFPNAVDARKEHRYWQTRLEKLRLTAVCTDGTVSILPTSIVPRGRILVWIGSGCPDRSPLPLSTTARTYGGAHTCRPVVGVFATIVGAIFDNDAATTTNASKSNCMSG